MPKKTTTALSPEHLDPLWKSLLEGIGGREGLLEAASVSSSPKAQELVALMLDQAHESWGTKKLARKAGLGADEIVDLYRNKKWLEATIALHGELPDIIRGASEDAKPSYVPCETCRGKKLDSNGIEDCYTCKGKGEVRRAGDKDKLSFIGEATGLTGKKGPINQFNQQIINAPANEASSFESLMKKATVQVTKQIEGVKDAEVVDEPQDS